jgi:hypothetical protein
MKRFGGAALALACLAATVVSGCVRTSDGVPVRGGDTARTGPAAPAPTSQPTESAESAVPGVSPTTREPIPPNALTCSAANKPAITMTAVVSDPRAPRITVAIPDGWTPSLGTGDVGARLDGPEGMWATVTIAATPLDAATAFTQYADRVMAASPVSSVSVLPAEFCGYSSQKLMGAWSDNPEHSVEFADRIAHIWTNSKNYLVAVHVQAPADAVGFDAASSELTDDFTVDIP